MKSITITLFVQLIFIYAGLSQCPIKILYQQDYDGQYNTPEENRTMLIFRCNRTYPLDIRQGNGAYFHCSVPTPVPNRISVFEYRVTVASGPNTIILNWNGRSLELPFTGDLELRPGRIHFYEVIIDPNATPCPRCPPPAKPCPPCPPSSITYRDTCLVKNKKGDTCINKSLIAGIIGIWKGSDTSINKSAFRTLLKHVCKGEDTCVNKSVLNNICRDKDTCINKSILKYICKGVDTCVNRKAYHSICKENDSLRHHPPYDNVNRFDALLLSAIAPGYGITKLNGGGKWWLASAGFYGVLAGSLGCYMSAKSNYHKYENSNSGAEQNDLYKKATNLNNAANTLLIISGAVWVANMVTTAVWPNKSKKNPCMTLGLDLDKNTYRPLLCFQYKF